MSKEYGEYKEKIVYCGVGESFGEFGRGYDIQQNPAELAAFMCKMKDLLIIPGDGSKILEIGTGTGGLYQLFRNMMKWDIYVIDTQQPQACHLKDRYCVAESNSEKARKFAKIKGPFELVFIDGDKSYDSVKGDYEIYKPFAKKLIAVHGTCGLRDCADVKKFWDEIEKDSNKGKAYIAGQAAAQSDQRAGIGWVITIK